MAHHQAFPLCHSMGCQDRWLAQVWVTQFKPNFWLISRFIFTPKLPLSPRYSAWNACDPAHWTEPHCSKEVKQTINLSAQSEDSEARNINLLFNLLFFLWIKGCLESTFRLEMQKFKSEQTLPTFYTWQEISPKKNRCGGRIFPWPQEILCRSCSYQRHRDVLTWSGSTQGNQNQCHESKDLKSQRACLWLCF